MQAVQKSCRRGFNTARKFTAVQAVQKGEGTGLNPDLMFTAVQAVQKTDIWQHAAFTKFTSVQAVQKVQNLIAENETKNNLQANTKNTYNKNLNMKPAEQVVQRCHALVRIQPK